MVARSAAGDVDVFWIVGGNFLETIARRDAIPRGSVTTSASSPSGHRSLIRDARRRRGRRSAAAGRRRATSRREAAPRRRPSGGSSSRPRSRAGGSDRPGRNGGCSGEVMARAARNGSTWSDWPMRPRFVTRSPAPIPLYRGIERLKAKGDQMQWGGRTLYTDGRFATPDGKAHFAAVTPRPSIGGRRSLCRLDAPRQAVQLDGPARLRSAHGGQPRRHPDQPRRPRASAPGRGRAPFAFDPRAERSAGSCDRRRSSPATWRCIGPRAMRCSRPMRSIPIRWSPTSTPR